MWHVTFLGFLSSRAVSAVADHETLVFSRHVAKGTVHVARGHTAGSVPHRGLWGRSVEVGPQPCNVGQPTMTVVYSNSTLF